MACAIRMETMMFALALNTDRSSCPQRSARPGQCHVDCWKSPAYPLELEARGLSLASQRATEMACLGVPGLSHLWAAHRMSCLNCQVPARQIVVAEADGDGLRLACRGRGVRRHQRGARERRDECA